MKQTPTKQLVIVGGGTAGWLTACVLAAEFDLHNTEMSVTVVESPDTPPIGVGEGTWPSMRSTLKKIGISESEFLRECDASLKQGTYFRDWSTLGDTYYHPFTLPVGYSELNLADYWLEDGGNGSAFAQSVSPQCAICDEAVAPKQIGVPDYGYVLNYGYHLDAGKFASLLKAQATERLGVVHTLANVIGIDGAANEDIVALETDVAGRIAGDLFIDCSGFKSLLVGEHYNIGKQSISNTLFNDRALAVQVPYDDPAAPIQSTTWSTAQRAGWIWDIGLVSRRGVGYVFSSRHTNEEEVRSDLDSYLRANGRQAGLDELTPRLLTFRPGYRKRFWHRNCVAVGLSSGFVEPLEASALVLVELAARAIADRLPADRTVMNIVAEEFNAEFQHRWEQIVDFLKLHYVLSNRDDTAYWRENRNPETLHTRLQDKLALWQTRSPWHFDDDRTDAMFPSASYQYVLYGMGFKPNQNTYATRRSFGASRDRARELFQEAKKQQQQYQHHLPSNRELLAQLQKRDFAKL